MKLNSKISKNIIFPISEIVTGLSVYSKLHFLNISKSWTREQINNYQNEKLIILINYAYNNIPYYKDLFDKTKIKPADIKTKHDLINLPILTKQKIKKEGIERFTSTKFNKSQIIKESSSGSTGEPLSYFITKEAYSMNIAANLRGWNGMGYQIGDKYIKLSQNSREKVFKIIQDKILNSLYLPTSPLVESNYDYILKKIEKYKPKIIRCYPDPLVFIARYKNKHPEFKHMPEAITTTGNMLFPETRQEIENSFKCKIYDSYSCEGNAAVFECISHTCYHSTEEYGISEIIDENGNQITKGIGRLISTDLWNLAHPFIKYDTQDYIEIDDEPCICGRSHLKIKQILGRDSEILVTPSGKFIVHNFTTFFSRQDLPTYNTIDQFQLIKKNNEINFNLIINNKFTSTTSNFIINYWEKEMKLPVKIKIVKNIPFTASGKRKFIINE